MLWARPDPETSATSPAERKSDDVHNVTWSPFHRSRQLGSAVPAWTRVGIRVSGDSLEICERQPNDIRPRAVNRIFQPEWLTGLVVKSLRSPYPTPNRSVSAVLNRESVGGLARLGKQLTCIEMPARYNVPICDQQ